MPEEAPYDPYIPSGGGAAPTQQQQPTGNARTQALQSVSSISVSAQVFVDEKRR